MIYLEVSDSDSDVVCTGAQPGEAGRKRSASLNRDIASTGSDSPHPSPKWKAEAAALHAKWTTTMKPKKKKRRISRVKSKEFVSSDTESD